MQKFNTGDFIQIAKDLGRPMSHFQADCEAIILGSYADEFGGSDTESYSLYIEGRGHTAWYHEWQLTLIEANRSDLLEQWKAEAKAEADQKSDLDWIFSHGEEVAAEPHSATIAALAKCFGLTNLWGGHGEGMTYAINANTTIRLSSPFLVAEDKEGWLEHCEKLKERLNHPR